MSKLVKKSFMKLYETINENKTLIIRETLLCKENSVMIAFELHVPHYNQQKYPGTTTCGGHASHKKEILERFSHLSIIDQTDFDIARVLTLQEYRDYINS